MANGKFDQFELPEENQEAKPLSVGQRIIIQNLFDTQKDKREAYLKQIGYELNPEDDNQYRPVGSQSGYAEIDPGISAYFQKGGLAEIGKDVTDVMFDTIISGPLSAAGAVGGATGGAVGGPLLAATGFVLGGGAGNAASEELKSRAADMLLDESIPTNYKEVALQSLITGTLPAVFKGGKKLAAGVASAAFDKAKDAMVRAAKSSGGGLNEAILQRAAKEPELFSKEAVDGATQRLGTLYKDIFGLDKPTDLRSTRQISGGIFADKMRVLNEAADAEIDALTKNSKVGFKLDELKAPFLGEIEKLASKFDRTSDEEAALKFMQNKIKFLDSKAKSLPEIVKGERNFTFKEGREFLKAIQDEAFDKDALGNYKTPGARHLIKVAGGNEDALRSLADRKAAEAGSKLPEINAQRSKILETYNASQKVLTPENIQSAFIGDDSIKKQQVRDITKLMDDTLGTNYSPMIETGAFQRVVENMYKNPKAFGSGRVLSDVTTQAVKSGAKGALTGAGIGGLSGVGAVPGAVIGGTIGAGSGALRGAAFSTPERALQGIRKASDLSQKATEMATESLVSPPSVEAILGAQAIAPAITPSLPEKKKPGRFDQFELDVE